jgi:hypothetical protein
MNQRDSERIQELCSLIAVEQDRGKFLALVEELNRILSNQEHGLKQSETKKKDDPEQR